MQRKQRSSTPKSKAFTRPKTTYNPDTQLTQSIAKVVIEKLICYKLRFEGDVGSEYYGYIFNPKFNKIRINSSDNPAIVVPYKLKHCGGQNAKKDRKGEYTMLPNSLLCSANLENVDLKGLKEKIKGYWG